ncbi:GTP-binding protein, partial [Candidatus Woesebacteria bacterium]|nr:GTP-binding protein [Candidatus Woesebacteria bacterium]
LGRTEATMPAEERIPNERLSLNQRLTFLLKDITEGIKGKEITLSRADPAFVEKLFAREVPEIGSGSVIIKAIAREPGVRTKIAVASIQSGVDPVGSCVGQKGVRVQAVTNELGGERVDIVLWSEDVAELLKASLSPAENLSVAIDAESKTARVTAPEDQLSLAIGKEGQNVRLASKLTGLRIEVEGVPAPQEKIERKEAVTEDSGKGAKKKMTRRRKKEVEENKEAGGITQRIGASQITTKEGKKITFIDTPGHAAFSKMRSRGAKVADIAVLVVSADDGVKPQTQEAIEIIKESKIPFLVAITKIDLPSADVEGAKGQLEKAGVLFEGKGGDTPVVPVSAKVGKGINELLETISVVAEVQEIKGNPQAPLEAVVIESSKDQRGAFGSPESRPRFLALAKFPLSESGLLKEEPEKSGRQKERRRWGSLKKEK